MYHSGAVTSLFLELYFVINSCAFSSVGNRRILSTCCPEKESDSMISTSILVSTVIMNYETLYYELASEWV